MSNTKGHAAIFAACLFLAGSAQAQDVVLRPLIDAAALTVTGQVLGFDGQFIRIATDLGELTVDYTKVSCDGTACPDINTFVPVIRLSGAPQPGEVILSPLIEGFARAHDMTFERQEGSPGQATNFLRDSTGSAETGRFEMSLTNSVEGFADLLANQADIALTTRPLSQDELALTRDAGLGQQTNRRAELSVRSD